MKKMVVFVGPHQFFVEIKGLKEEKVVKLGSMMVNITKIKYFYNICQKLK